MIMQMSLGVLCATTAGGIVAAGLTSGRMRLLPPRKIARRLTVGVPLMMIMMWALDSYIQHLR